MQSRIKEYDGIHHKSVRVPTYGTDTRYMGNETRLQESVATYLRMKKRFFIHVANERMAKKQYHASLKKQGVRPGVCDVIFFDDRIAIELKTKYNKPSPEQADFMADIMMHGYQVAVCYSLDGVIDFLDDIENME